MAHRTRRNASQRKRGRPTKLTAELTDQLAQILRAGNYLDTAADHAGIDRSTIYRWLKAAEDDDAPAELRAFRDALAHARADAEARMVATIFRDAIGGVVVKRTTRRFKDVTEVEETITPPNGRVALEYLARSRPQSWSRRDKTELTGADGAPIQVQQKSVVIGVLADRLHEQYAGELPPAPDHLDGDDGDAGEPIAS